MTKARAAEMKEAQTRLREILRPGNTVLTTVKHVSQSGMLRVIDAHVIKRGKPIWLSSLIARALDMPLDKRDRGVRVGGCGMDMGFALVYDLSFHLWPKRGPRAGYLLKQQWM